MEQQYVQSFEHHPAFSYTQIRQGNIFHTERQQWWFDFDNGFSVSVIMGSTTFGGNDGLYELAALRSGQIYPYTPLGGDVFGYLSEDDVLEYLARIEHFVVDDDGEWVDGL